MNLKEILEIDNVTAGGIFTAIDFCISIIASILNVIIVVTIKNSSYLCKDITYVLFASLGASNLGMKINFNCFYHGFIQDIL